MKGADRRAPERLPFGAKHKFHKGLGELGLGGPTEDRNRIATDRAARGGGRPNQASRARPVNLVGEGGPVVIHAHARGGITVGHIEGDLGGTIGEVAGICRETL